MSAVVIEDLHRDYGEVKAVRGVSLRGRPGELWPASSARTRRARPPPSASPG
ncbi:MAG: hypothetical protein R3B82_03660 [Sandaracinaceae bacterium]